MIAFVAGCLVDLVSAIAREAAALGIAPRVQMRVVGLVWVVDACLAPVGLMVANAARNDPQQLLLILPLSVLLMLFARDRSARIAQAQHRLELLGRERHRLQGAVSRLGDAFAARLDLDALTDIVLSGAVEALDADGGRLTLDGPDRPRVARGGVTPAIAPHWTPLPRASAIGQVRSSATACGPSACPIGFTSRVQAGPRRDRDRPDRASVP